MLTKYILFVSLLQYRDEIYRPKTLIKNLLEKYDPTEPASKNEDITNGEILPILDNWAVFDDTKKKDSISTTKDINNVADGRGRARFLKSYLGLCLFIVELDEATFNTSKKIDELRRNYKTSEEMLKGHGAELRSFLRVQSAIISELIDPFIDKQSDVYTLEKPIPEGKLNEADEIDEADKIAKNYGYLWALHPLGSLQSKLESDQIKEDGFVSYLDKDFSDEIFNGGYVVASSGGLGGWP